MLFSFNVSYCANPYLELCFLIFKVVDMMVMITQAFPYSLLKCHSTVVFILYTLTLSLKSI